MTRIDTLRYTNNIRSHVLIINWSLRFLCPVLDCYKKVLILENAWAELENIRYKILLHEWNDLDLNDLEHQITVKIHSTFNI